MSGEQNKAVASTVLKNYELDGIQFLPKPLTKNWLHGTAWIAPYTAYVVLIFSLSAGLLEPSTAIETYFLVTKWLAGLSGGYLLFYLFHVARTMEKPSGTSVAIRIGERYAGFRGELAADTHALYVKNERSGQVMQVAWKDVTGFQSTPERIELLLREIKGLEPVKVSIRSQSVQLQQDLQMAFEQRDVESKVRTILPAFRPTERADSLYSITAWVTFVLPAALLIGIATSSAFLPAFMLLAGIAVLKLVGSFERRQSIDSLIAELPGTKEVDAGTGELPLGLAYRRDR